MAIQVGTEAEFLYSRPGITSSCRLDNTHFALAYPGTSSYGRVKIGVIANNAITFGNEYTFSASATGYPSVIIIDSTHFVISFRDTGNSGHGKSVVATVANGTQVTFGTVYEFNNAGTVYINSSILDSTHFIVSYNDDGNTGYGTAIIGVISGETISFGSEYVYLSDTSYSNKVKAIDSTHFVVAYQNSTYQGKNIIGTVSSGTTISFGTEYTYLEDTNYTCDIDLLDSSHFVVFFRDSNGSTANAGTAIIGTIASVNQISYGSEYSTGVYFNPAYPIVALSATKFAIIAAQSSDSAKLKCKIANINGSYAISYEDSVEFDADSMGAGPSACKITENMFAVSYDNAATTGQSRLGYFAASGPANLKTYNTNLKANIKSINTNLIANCKSLNTNT